MLNKTIGSIDPKTESKNKEQLTDPWPPLTEKDFTGFINVEQSRNLMRQPGKSTMILNMLMGAYRKEGVATYGAYGLSLAIQSRLGRSIYQPDAEFSFRERLAHLRSKTLVTMENDLTDMGLPYWPVGNSFGTPVIRRPVRGYSDLEVAMSDYCPLSIPYRNRFSLANISRITPISLRHQTFKR